MRIFVTGASGYVGSAVAAACARAGHDVFGLVRAEEKARRLAAHEVQPVMGSMGDPASYRKTAQTCSVLIHCAAEYSAEYWKLDRTTVDAFLAAAGEGGRPRLVIYTSGVWLYGSTGDSLVDETTPLAPPAFMAQRLEHEKLVLAANRGAVRTAIVRPGCVYGGRGGLTAGWFESAVKEGAARLVGDGEFRWAMVHRIDLADAYLRVAESPSGGEVFNVTDRSRASVLECSRAASRAAGAEGKVVHTALADAAKAMGAMADALVFDQHVDSRKAVRMLGWQPRFGGFADGAERYFAAWKASQPA